MTSQHLSRADLLDVRSVLERAIQRHERDRHRRAAAVGQDSDAPDPEADALAAAVADLNDELAGMR